LKEWNETYSNDFANWKISIKNEINQTIELNKDERKMLAFDDSINIHYKPFQYISSNFTDLLADIKLNKLKKVKHSYFV